MYRDGMYRIGLVSNEDFENNQELLHHNQEKIDKLFQILLQNDEPNNVFLITESDEFSTLILPPSIVNAFIYTATISREIKLKELDGTFLVIEYYAEILEQLIKPLKNLKFSVNITLDVLTVYLQTINDYIDQTVGKNAKYRYELKEQLSANLERQLYFFALYTHSLASEFQGQVFNHQDVKSYYIDRQEHNEQLAELKSNVYTHIGELSVFATTDEAYNAVMEQIITLYRSLQAFDGESGTMLDCFARLHYHGEDHPEYAIAIATLEAAIYHKVENLPIPDLAKLFFDIEEDTRDWIKDIEDWKTFKKKLLETAELARVTGDMKEDFLNYVSEKHG